MRSETSNSPYTHVGSWTLYRFLSCINAIYCFFLIKGFSWTQQFAFTTNKKYGQFSRVLFNSPTLFTLLSISNGVGLGHRCICEIRPRTVCDCASFKPRVSNTSHSSAGLHVRFYISVLSCPLFFCLFSNKNTDQLNSVKR